MSLLWPKNISLGGARNWGRPWQYLNTDTFTSTTEWWEASGFVWTRYWPTDAVLCLSVSFYCYPQGSSIYMHTRGIRKHCIQIEATREHVHRRYILMLWCNKHMMCPQSNCAWSGVEITTKLSVICLANWSYKHDCEHCPNTLCIITSARTNVLPLGKLRQIAWGFTWPVRPPPLILPCSDFSILHSTRPKKCLSTPVGLRFRSSPWLLVTSDNSPPKYVTHQSSFITLNIAHFWNCTDHLRGKSQKHIWPASLASENWIAWISFYMSSNVTMSNW